MDSRATAPSKDGMKDIYIGRQTIYDRQMAVFAYELLFRTGQQNASHVNQSTNGDCASSEVLLNAIMETGLERIAGPHRVFVNLTRKLFLNHSELLFDKDRIVMELLEDIPVDDHLLQACRQLASQGYQLALDDYAFEPSHEPLLPWVNFIKVEVQALSPERIRQSIPGLKQRGLKLLAEKIETEEQYQQTLELGFDYFQGYHFSRPKVLAGKRLEENQLVVLRLVSELNDPDVTLDALERLITQDARFSYKILRYMNSAALGMPRQVDSIRQAVLYMGLNRIRAWASLLALTRLQGRSPAYFTTALVRAHMCEQLVARSGGCPAETGFTVGLLSILDLLMDLPLAEILAELGLSDEIRSALLKRQGLAGKALRCTLAYEFQQWEEAGFDGMKDEETIQIYMDASEKAFAEEQALQQSP